MTDKPSRLESLVEIGRAISRQKDYPTLFRLVIEEACACLEAEGGTFYFYDKTAHILRAVVAINQPLGLDHVIGEFNPLDIQGLFNVKLHAGEKEDSISGECWRRKQPVVVYDTATESHFDLTGVQVFDREYSYQTKSIIAVPLLSQDNSVLGVVQLVNAKSALQSQADVELVEALASMMGMALENNLLLLGTKTLLNAVVEMISTAIDRKSAVTAGHCTRVTELTMMLAQKMVEDKDGPYRDFDLSPEELDELRVAALLHDVGKIATPDLVLEKSRKLEQRFDKIEYLRMRFMIRQLERRNEMLAAQLRDQGIEPQDGPLGQSEKEDFAFVEAMNQGGEFLAPEKQERLLEIAQRSCMGETLIDKDDLENLLIKRGTLNADERVTMEKHASISIQLLDKLPWPEQLKEVPEIAGRHHENCDGTGYPQRLTGDQMSLRAKILSLTDRFEGISAPDRQYRKPMTLDQTMEIMQIFSDNNKIDPQLFAFFVDKGVHLEYAREHLNKEQLGEKEEAVSSSEASS